VFDVLTPDESASALARFSANRVWLSVAPPQELATERYLPSGIDWLESAARPTSYSVTDHVAELDQQRVEHLG